MPDANNLSWSWNKIPNYLRHSPRVVEAAEVAAAAAAVVAKIMAVSQTMVAAHAKAAAVAAVAVAVASVAETPPSERRTLPKLQQMGSTFPCGVFFLGSKQQQTPRGMEGKASSLTGAGVARR
jgi:hypothetical protein